MSDTRPIEGWCFICGDSYDDADHFEKIHQSRSRKPKVEIRSWEHRLDNIIQALQEIKDDPDRGVQIERLDEEVIAELYLVRARLAQLKGTPVKRVKEGS
jgi:hypothetical protein